MEPSSFRITDDLHGPTRQWDACVIGGGLAGLSLSILIAQAGYTVALFEKEKYPFHKVCGEYISLESWPFIEKLGLPLGKMNLPKIKRLAVSSPSGNIIKSKLDLGGFGISRYLLDTELCKIARENGVAVFEETKVNEVMFNNNIFTIETPERDHQAKIVAGTFGKRSNLDIKLARSFTTKKPTKLNNYIAVKYHIQTTLPANETIVLHNFKNGYCGMSQIEDNKYCLCYLTTALNLKENNNSISAMEKNVLQLNPYLKQIFSSSTFLYSSPVVISQVSFEKKTQVQDHMLMVGDAAGMITPLCGNGMSMAFQAAKLAFGSIDEYLKNKISRRQMEDQYGIQWRRAFGRRLATGRIIQRFFGKPWVTNLFIGVIKHFPFLTRQLIRSTHGKPF